MEEGKGISPVDEDLSRNSFNDGPRLEKTRRLLGRVVTGAGVETSVE
jgi:hypothetical protein